MNAWGDSSHLSSGTPTTATSSTAVEGGEVNPMASFGVLVMQPLSPQGPETNVDDEPIARRIVNVVHQALMSVVLHDNGATER